MIVTKYQAKQLQYKARANKSSRYSTRTVNGCKVKHREFPSYNLSYDESKDSSGNCILTNVLLDSVPFNGTYDELLGRIDSSASTNPGLVQGCPTIQLEAIVPTNEEPADSTNNVELTFMDKNQGFTSTLEYNGAVIATSIAMEQPNVPIVKKVLTKVELNELRIKCATMKLASMYGEPIDASISTIVGKYPDAVNTLSQLYAQDKIKPYTISEDDVKTAYPDEFRSIFKSLD